MKNFYYSKQIFFAVLTALLIIVSIVVYVTETNRNMTNKSPFLSFLIDKHTAILFLFLIFAIAFGFFWSNITYVELEKQKKESKNILDIILLFLNKEEKEIIKFLVENNGFTTQSEISKLPGLDRVKAHRSLQKMQEKRLIDIQEHGKIRKVKLKEDILNVIKAKI
jgi:uncharacterized membrane protein